MSGRDSEWLLYRHRDVVQGPSPKKIKTKNIHGAWTGTDTWTPLANIKHSPLSYLGILPLPLVLIRRMLNQAVHHTMADQLCSTCHEPLLLEVEPDSDIEDSKASARIHSVPDDVELSCACHFHW